MLEELHHGDFAARNGDTFAVRLGDGEAIDLRLVDVQRFGGDSSGGGRTPFSLLFRGGPADRYLPQQTYELSHPDLGVLSIFLVPLGPDAEGMRYEAVFN